MASRTGPCSLKQIKLIHTASQKNTSTQHRLPTALNHTREMGLEDGMDQYVEMSSHITSPPSEASHAHNGSAASGDVTNTESVSSKTVRGLAKGHALDKHVRRNGKYKLVFMPGETIPLTYESEFATGTSLVIRTTTEVQRGLYWRNISDANKEVCYARLLQWFEIDGWGTDGRVERIVDHKFQTAYTRWRCTLHIEYRKLEKQGINPREVCPRSDLNMIKWRMACDFIEDEKYQARCSINRTNRLKMPFSHTTGRTSLLSRYRRMENKSKIELWKDVHTTKKNGGGFVNSIAKSKYDAMLEKLDETIDQDEREDEGEILKSTLGHRSGYLKGMGHGVEVIRGSRFRSDVVAISNFNEKMKELDNAKEKINELTQAYESQKKEMDTYKDQNKSYVEQIKTLQTQMGQMQQFFKDFEEFEKYFPSESC